MLLLYQLTLVDQFFTPEEMSCIITAMTIKGKCKGKSRVRQNPRKDRALSVIVHLRKHLISETKALERSFCRNFLGNRWIFSERTRASSKGLGFIKST